MANDGIERVRVRVRDSFPPVLRRDRVLQKRAIAGGGRGEQERENR